MKIETLTLSVTYLLAMIARSGAAAKMVSMASLLTDDTMESAGGVASRAS